MINRIKKVGKVFNLVRWANTIDALVDFANGLRSGDGLIEVVNGQTFRLNVNRLRSRIPQLSGGGSGGPQYAIVTEVPEYNDPVKNKFVVQKASKNADDEWAGDGTDIDIERALGFEGHVTHEGNDNAKDIRNWHPWPSVGTVVQIIQKWDAEQETPANRWYMTGEKAPSDYGGSESVASLRVDDETLLTQAVWV